MDPNKKEKQVNLKLNYSFLIMILKSNSITFLGLIVILSLVTGTLDQVQAVTDAELEALEKQLEQQEADELKQAKEKAKRKAEIKAKQQAEQRQLEEQKRIEADRKQKEAAIAAEKARKLQEEKEAKQKLEVEKAQKYNALIVEAEQAINDKDKETAINKYTEALTLKPSDQTALNGIREADKLMDKVCYAFIGTWERKEFIGSSMFRIAEKGTFYFGNTDDNYTSWTCYPKKRQIKTQRFPASFELNADGTCITVSDWSGDSCYERTSNKP